MWLAIVAVVVGVLQLLGVDVRGWISNFWDALTEVSWEYIVAGLALQTVQTTLTALGWLFILRAGFPDAEIPYRAILAAYAAGIAMNGFLPANIGTFASLLMFTALIAGATFPGVLGAMVVQKIFFTVAGTAVYLYLFLSVPGSFALQLGWFEDHRGLAVIIIAGGALLLVMVVRAFWSRLRGLREKAKQGGAILLDAARLLRAGVPALARCLARQARRHRGLPRGLLHPRHLPHGHDRHRRELAGQHRLGHARRGRHQPSHQHGLVERRDLARERRRLLDRPAADRDRVQRRLRPRARRLGLRLVRREALVEGSYAGAKEKVAEQKAERGGAQGCGAGAGGGRGRKGGPLARASSARRKRAVSHQPPEPERPRFRLYRILIAWLLSAATLLFAAWVLPGVAIEGVRGALVAAALIAVLNAILPPLLAALRLPFTLVLGVLLVLALDAAMFMLVADIAPNAISVDSWWAALGAAFVASVASVTLDPIFRTNDDETYMLRVTQRIARRSGEQVRTDVPGVIFLEIDGLGLPVLQRAMRDGNASANGALDRGGLSRARRVGDQTSRPRPAPARPGSCSAPTRTSRRSDGSRRRAGGR